MVVGDGAVDDDDELAMVQVEVEVRVVIQLTYGAGMPMIDIMHLYHLVFCFL